ncbi:GntR family transcriptional regulator [Rubinisphaera sp.]|uniref:GntR family transcriptional regulator n=1 Tax=Rubinisphaera sp. TaxID=2024857 RepID=UPI000C0CF7D9|nr:GntR family transcriptional regulator [Rubinisphaera sp.]MBV08602.1 GntR family transcriptional regulator [Rubinisphaera sp.]HCS55054.1 GntR family transcriptional regulator [Planctomycetaceae bacterium]|tara:strand:+ start:647 stop:1027 length:381 start_codon:yes stop_codon:yes gene_type:complete
MFFQIESGSGVPIFEQICRQIKYAIAQGSFKSGDLLPSVRELAGTLAVNANTIARSYRELQREGIVISVRGTGMEITKEAKAICVKERKRLAQENLTGVLAEAQASELSESEVRAWMDREIRRLWK